MTVLAEQPTTPAADPAACDFDWCDAKRDGVPHDDHIGTSGDLKHLHGREFYQDFEPADRIANYVTMWVSQHGDLPTTFSLNLAHDWSASAATMTREQTSKFAECVLFWLACMNGVTVDEADALAGMAVEWFETSALTKAVAV